MKHFIPFIIVSFFVSHPLHADVFTIKDGGRIEGKILNPGETVAQIQTASGVVFAVDSKLIEETKTKQENRLYYSQTVPLESDTVENHIRIALWCTENRLGDLAQIHWDRVLELDPDNLEIRKKLGYFKDKTTGEWTTTEQQMAARGLVKSGAHYLLPQEIKIKEIVQTQQNAEQEWKKSINRMSSSLGNSAARNALQKIDDPAATKPLLDALKKEKNAANRILYIRALSNIGTSVAIREIAGIYMGENNEGVRGACLDEIKKHPDLIPTAGQVFGGYLTSRNADRTSRIDPGTINSAAYAIGIIGDRNQIGNLVGALVTQHKETITEGGTNRYDTAFSRTGSGSGLSMGTKTTVVINDSQNESVLESLKVLTRVNFRYNVDAWREWMQQKQKPVPFKLRRD